MRNYFCCYFCSYRSFWLYSVNWLPDEAQLKHYFPSTFLYLIPIACASFKSTAVDRLTRGLSLPVISIASWSDLPADLVLTVGSCSLYPAALSQKKHVPVVRGCLRTCKLRGWRQCCFPIRLCSFGPASSRSHLKELLYKKKHLFLQNNSVEQFWHYVKGLWTLTSKKSIFRLHATIVNE